MCYFALSVVTVRMFECKYMAHRKTSILLMWHSSNSLICGYTDVHILVLSVHGHDIIAGEN